MSALAAFGGGVMPVNIRRCRARKHLVCVPGVSRHQTFHGSVGDLGCACASQQSLKAAPPLLMVTRYSRQGQNGPMG